MPHRLAIVLLALSVFVANAYCACLPVTPGTAISRETGVGQAVHPACHGHGEERDSERGEQDCGHCKATSFADNSGAKQVAPAERLSPLYCGAAGLPWSASVAGAIGHCLDHSGLPPPVSPPTLLSLACSFTN